MTDTSGVITRREIFQQPELWKTTLDRVAQTTFSRPKGGPVIVTGAGSSAYAAEAVASAWPDASAIPTTDLLLQSKEELARFRPGFSDNGTLVSLARSGDSPESVAVVESIRRWFPFVRHLVITCNLKGQLAGLSGVEMILLDPRTNDRSLVMTSSFTNLVLAGLLLTSGAQIAPVMNQLCKKAEQELPKLDALAEQLATSDISRVVILASGGLKPLGREVALKILEMTGGKVLPMAETFLGVRHGPMSFLRQDALVLCWMSTDPLRRRYELDLLEELGAKKLGKLLVIDSAGNNTRQRNAFAPAVAPGLADELRVPFEILFGQLLAYHLSLRSGLNPDSPSPHGVITRVVQGVRVHEREKI